MYYFCEEARKKFDHKVAPNTRLRTHVSVFCAIFTEIYFFFVHDKFFFGQNCHVTKVI